MRRQVPATFDDARYGKRSTVSRLLLLLCLVIALRSVMPASKADAEEILEVNVTNAPAFKDGQPAVAVNPTNPDNLVLSATHHTCAVEPAARPGSTPCPAHSSFLAYSMDRGATWTSVPWPGDPNSGEVNVAVDPAGNFYVIYNALGAGGIPITDWPVALARSSDGGQTWTVLPPSSLDAAGDPHIRIDAATGKIYVQGAFEVGLLDLGLAFSADHGQTWSQPFPMHAEHLAVHDGILVTATDQGALTFHVSTNDGQTYTPRPVINTLGVPVPAGTCTGVPETGIPGLAAIFDSPCSEDGSPWVSADPTRTGRFAVMVSRAVPNIPNAPINTYQVYVTENSGMTWTGPAVIAAPGWAFPWMDFGPTGLLGVIWRTGAPTSPVLLDPSPTAVDVYSVVSFDHGHSFSAPVKVNSVTGPNTGTGPPGDDWSWITADDDHAFVGWADARNGDLEGFFARVPLSFYE